MTNDAIIAGGGVAGAAAAAALAGTGYRVLVIEPGLDHSRRLAGELIHPPGVADLNELGLLACLQHAGAVPVHGFAVFAGKAADAADIVLSYSEVEGLRNDGLAIEHRLLSQALLNEVASRPNVTVWNGARVVAIDLTAAGHARVTVSHEGRDEELQASMVVAADGRHSHVRRMAGIGETRTHLSDMLGYVLDDSRLPHSRFGHVFAGGPAPALAYEIKAGETRIMFDLPAHASNGRVPQQLAAYVAELPEPVQSDAVRAIEKDRPLVSANYSVVPDAVIKGRLVCVGDAGGCCHPISASGLSTCMRDAIRLKRALSETAGDVPNALRRYAALREAPEHTRLAGAELLYDVLKAETPEMRLMRSGLLRYWQQNPRGRAATMALLSTHEARFSVMMREYIRVCRYALPDIWHMARWESRGRTVMGLSRSLLKVVGQNRRLKHAAAPK